MHHIASSHVVWLAAMCMACSAPRQAPTPAPRAPESAPTTAPEPPAVDAGAPVAEAGAPTVAVEPPPAPFALPPIDGAPSASPATREASLYLSEQFYRDCVRPMPVSGWASADGTWSVTAFRCKAPIPERPTPDPWLSDGRFFLWASRGTLVIEVYAHQGKSPSPKQWRAYLDKAIAGAPAEEGESPQPTEEPRVERKKAEAFLAKLRRLAGQPGRGRCARGGLDAYEALGIEMDRIVPNAPGVLEEAAREVAQCHACGSPGVVCWDALREIARASEWARRHGK